jgi:choice-of-anchor A domain-containing protein/LPXTG-motif cell wall-anchored protein
VNKKIITSLIVSVLSVTLIVGLMALNPFYAKANTTEVDYSYSNFGDANDFNVFTFGDLSQSGDQVHGRMFVGGNAVLSSYGIGVDLPQSSTEAYLIVEGNYNIANGSNKGIAVFKEPKVSPNNYTMGSSIIADPATLTGANRVDLPATEKYLDDATSQWGDLSQTGTVSVYYGQLTLTGSDTSLNVFNINPGDIPSEGKDGDKSDYTLSEINHIEIDVPTGSTVLINVSGTDVTFPNCSYVMNGTTLTAGTTLQQYILWNLPDAQSAHSVSLEGSALAPYATWYLNGGEFVGSLITDKVDGGNKAEPHNVLFTGHLPQITYIVDSSSSSQDGSSSSQDVSSSSQDVSSSSQDVSSSSQDVSSSSQDVSSSSQDGSSSSQDVSSSSQDGSSSSQDVSSSSQDVSSSSSEVTIIPSNSTPTGPSPSGSGSTVSIGDNSVPHGSGGVSSPKTGDATTYWLPMMMGIITISLLILVILFIRRRDSKKSDS